ncbi:MAG: sensor histidine kinase [Paracoccus denitrificans]|nr:MAG: sensor histidine kinase [Paracoccus denitrificans]PZO82842.1 MAG: sensor histidine kinase [Paracoccus denitrificans]
MPGDSIRLRLLGLAAIWLTLALVVAYFAISLVLSGFVTSRYSADADAVADTLIANAQIDGTGITLTAQPADPRFRLPLGGWYWQINGGSTPLVRSPSLFDTSLLEPRDSKTLSSITGPDGELLLARKKTFTLPDSDAQFLAIVALPWSEISAAQASVRRPLVISLVVLGLGLMAAIFLQVGAGLSSLTAMGRNIREIREGRVETLPLPRVAELRPIAAELNALTAENQATLTRAREHLGNLAHSLKTPLAALSNSLPPDHPAQALVQRMDSQIGWHLRRARSAGATRMSGKRVSVAEVLDDLLLVLNRPIAERDLQVDTVCEPDLTFPGDRQDLEEMLGNLLENAVKWAATRVTIDAACRDGQLRVQISDDGPGMQENEHIRALTRGVRLDEAGQSGSGLGLAIVTDLATLHGGTISLDQASIGGLQVTLSLPA